MMESITVKLGKNSYPITIDSGLFNKQEAFWPLKMGDNAMLVTNDCLASLYLTIILDCLTKSGITVEHVILPDGERYKSITMLNVIITELLQKSYGRDTTLIALGGGVIGDLTGFAASSYQRGVRFIQVPTTLLSQVDASIGGKTAINHPLGKNMIGSFYQPSSVIIDLDCLKTLPRREFVSGLAEIIKYGIIFDYKFFDWIEKNLESLIALDTNALAYCIRRCCEIKSQFVIMDEYEHNIRSLLNLGHTYGHAIEAYLGYGKWLHGEAISAGIMMAAQTACYLGKFNKINLQRLKILLLRAGLPINGPSEMKFEDYFPYMMRDKKVIFGKLRLVIPLELGKATIVSDVEHDIVKASIEACH